MADPMSMALTALNVKDKKRELDQGKRLSEKSLERIGAFREGFNQLQNLANLKSKGFAGRGIDTGPIAQHYPNVASSAIAKLTGVPPRGQGDRRKLEQATLWFLNPIRKDVTGAQAAIEELRSFLQPMIPQLKDNDPDWNSAAIEAAGQLANKYTTYVDQLKGAGYHVPGEFDPKNFLKSLDTTIYGKE